MATCGALCATPDGEPPAPQCRSPPTLAKETACNVMSPSCQSPSGRTGWSARADPGVAIQSAKVPDCALRSRSGLRTPYFASGSGRTWMCTAIGRAPLPSSLSHGVRSPLALHRPRPFQPAFGSSMRRVETLGVEAHRIRHAHQDHLAVLEADEAVLQVGGRDRNVRRRGRPRCDGRPRCSSSPRRSNSAHRRSPGPDTCAASKPSGQ